MQTNVVSKKQKQMTNSLSNILPVNLLACDGLGCSSRCPLQIVTSLSLTQTESRCVRQRSHANEQTRWQLQSRSADGEMLLMSWRLSGNFPQSAEQVMHSTACYWSVFCEVSLTRRGGRVLLVNTGRMWWTTLQVWDGGQMELLFGHLHFKFLPQESVTKRG